MMTHGEQKHVKKPVEAGKLRGRPKEPVKRSKAITGNYDADSLTSYLDNVRDSYHA